MKKPNNVRIISHIAELSSMRFEAVFLLYASQWFSNSSFEAFCASLLSSGGGLYVLGWNEKRSPTLDDSHFSAALAELFPGPQEARRQGKGARSPVQEASPWIDTLKSRLYLSLPTVHISADFISRDDEMTFALRDHKSLQPTHKGPELRLTHADVSAGASQSTLTRPDGGRRRQCRYLLRQKVSHPPGCCVFVAASVYPALQPTAAQLSNLTVQRIRAAVTEFRRVWEEHSSPLSYCQPASPSCFVVTPESNEAVGMRLMEACEEAGFAPGELLLDSRLSATSPAGKIISQQIIKTPVLLYEVEVEDSEACVASLAEVHILFTVDCRISPAETPEPGPASAGTQKPSALLSAYDRRVLSGNTSDGISVYLQRTIPAPAAGVPSRDTGISLGQKAVLDISTTDTDGYVPISSNRQFYCMSKLLFGTETDSDGHIVIKRPEVTDTSAHEDLIPLYALTPSLPWELHLRGSKFIYYLACCVSPLGCPARELEYQLVNSAFDMAIGGAPDSEIYSYLKSKSKRTDSSEFLNSRVSTRAEEIVTVLRGRDVKSLYQDGSAKKEKPSRCRNNRVESDSGISISGHPGGGGGRPRPERTTGTVSISGPPLLQRGNGASSLCRFLAEMEYDSMLDVGCADGRIAARVAKGLGVPPGNVCGIDVRAVQNPDLTFLRCNVERMPLRDVVPPSSFSLCTCTMVLHHFRNWREVLAQLYDVLVPGGILLVRDSLPNNPLIRYFLDIQHAMYAFIIQDEMPIDAFVNGFSTNYFTEQELRDALGVPGFEILSCKYDSVADKFRKAWIIARKPPGGRASSAKHVSDSLGDLNQPDVSDDPEEERPVYSKAGVSISLEEPMKRAGFSAHGARRHQPRRSQKR